MGRHRQTEIGVTVKGSRALVKVYTDVQLVVDQAQACYGNGLEPTIAMVRYTAFILSFAFCMTNVTTIPDMQLVVHHRHAPQAGAHNRHCAV